MGLDLQENRIEHKFIIKNLVFKMSRELLQLDGICVPFGLINNIMNNCMGMPVLYVLS